MRDRPGSHRVDVSLSAVPQPVETGADEAAPYCIALLGDFSARAHRGAVEGTQAIASREPLVVDRDTVDTLLARLRPELEIRTREGDPPLRVRFTEIADFHPDRLYERLPLFEGVRELRRRLTESDDVTKRPRTGPAPGPPPAASGATPRTGSLLDQVVEQSATNQEAPSPLEGGDLQAYLNRLVAPYAVPAADPRRQAVLAQLDRAAESGMRALLHHPEFQALEGLWRGVHLLTQRNESEATVQFYLVDVSKTELAADQDEHAEIQDSAIYQLLARPPGAAPEARWAALGGLYSFGPESRDLALLGHLGAVARRLGAPWIAAAEPRLAGCESIEETPDPSDWTGAPDPGWEALRKSREAPWIGLAWPRFLLRLPYGRHGTWCEALQLEEVSDGSPSDEYLWGNPAVACLLLLAARAADPSTSPGMNLEIEGLPLHLAAGPGGAGATPGAEVLLGERAAQRLLDRGLMALASVRGTDRIRLVRFQSIARPAAPLAGLAGATAG